ncbi:MAG: hypothetical protein ACI93T_000902, partial [Porticoccaceae bacterium]
AGFDDGCGVSTTSADASSAAAFFVVAFVAAFFAAAFLRVGAATFSLAGAAAFFFAAFFFTAFSADELPVAAFFFVAFFFATPQPPPFVRDGVRFALIHLLSRTEGPKSDSILAHSGRQWIQESVLVWVKTRTDAGTITQSPQESTQWRYRLLRLFNRPQTDA